MDYTMNLWRCAGSIRISCCFRLRGERRDENRKMILCTGQGKSEFYAAMKEVEGKLLCYRFVRVQRAFFGKL